MMNVNKLRALIVIEIALYALLFIIGFNNWHHYGLDSDLIAVIETRSETNAIVPKWHLCVMSLNTFLWGYSLFKLWFLGSYSRCLYTISLLLGWVVFLCVSGNPITNVYVGLIEGLSYTVSGMILGMLYFSNLYKKERSEEIEIN